MRTYGIDFDGVIHSFDKGYHDGTIYGTPIDGAIESIRFIMKSSTVFIFTARRPLSEVVEWMRNFGFECVLDDGREKFWNTKGVILVTNRKIPAFAYIDDRAVRFESWNQTMHDIRNLKGDWAPSPNYWEKYA